MLKKNITFIRFYKFAKKHKGTDYIILCRFKNPPKDRNKMKFTKNTNNYLSLVKFSHTVFALPFALMGFAWAIGSTDINFDFGILTYVVFCMVTARNTAMAFNRIIDYKFDKLNPRTAVREIPSGVISLKNAIIFTIINAVLFVISASMINTLTMYLSPVALIVIMGYSLVKRFSWICHYILGLSLGIAPIAAYISVTGYFDLFTIILSVIVVTWVSSFDILYSLQDEGFDKDNKLHSIPERFGRVVSLVISATLHMFTIVFVVWLGVLYELNNIYWAGAVVFSIIIIAEHFIVTPRNISRVNLAFATFNSFGSIIYCGFSIASFFVN